MIHKTPAADADPLAEAQQSLVAILALLADSEPFAELQDDPPGLYSVYLTAAAEQARAAALALQTAAGRAQRAVEAAARERGWEMCVICHIWKPIDSLVRDSTGYEGKERGRTNHWFHCEGCGISDLPYVIKQKGDEP